LRRLEFEVSHPNLVSNITSDLKVDGLEIDTDQPKCIGCRTPKFLDCRSPETIGASGGRSLAVSV
jgi:hypothetical protein